VPVDSAGAARSRLAWHCRRGTRELDLLLQRWLEQRYEGCDAAQRALFEALLEMPDPALADYLLAGVRPTQPELAGLVQAIRGLAMAGRERPGRPPAAAGYNKSDN
jgi:antitoxin CptB